MWLKISHVVSKGVLCEKSKNMLGSNTIKDELHNWPLPGKRNPIACVCKKSNFWNIFHASVACHFEILHSF